jgi:cobalt-precorrin-5B (C1)-methyltransferase
MSKNASASPDTRKPAGPLNALLTGTFPDPVAIRLPKGEEPAFALALEGFEAGAAFAGIVKDAGDDPDVTHGATIIAHVRHGSPASGLVLKAGDGVGTVTRPGLPVAVGDPAINPAPRAMIGAIVEELCAAHAVAADIDVTLSIPGGAAIAEKTWNPRLGIMGGLSILGTTGIVHPFSCAAWIHSIHRGIDVARATGLSHVLGSTGSTSEDAARAFHGLPETALIDMGDFAGGLLKYLRVHPVPRLTIAGGFAKLTKLAQGALDLHSARSQVDMEFLAVLVGDDRADDDLRMRIQSANTAMEVLELARHAGIEIAAPVAQRARATALATLQGAPIDVDILVIDRAGSIIAHAR